MKLTVKQTIALDYLEDDQTTELLYGGSAGGGKSLLGCYWQLKRRLKYPGTRGMIGRDKLKNIKDTTLKTLFEVGKMQGLVRGSHYDLLGAHDKENPNCIEFVNGSLIYLRDLFLYPADPDFDSLGSIEITDAYIDECSAVSEKAKTIVSSRIRYKLDEFGLVPKQLYTTNPFKGWGYREFYKKAKEGSLEPFRQFVPALPKDNPYLPASYLEQLLRLPDKEKQRLYYGNWEYDDSPDALIPYDKILDLFTNQHVTQGKDTYITADIARLGRDSTVICIWRGWVLVDLIEIEKNLIDEAANRIKELARRYSVPMSRIVVDEDGVGGGVCDLLRCKGFVNNSSPIRTPEARELTTKTENYTNLKSQCYFMLAERINRADIHITASLTLRQKDYLIAELEQVKDASYGKDGKKAVMSKDKVKEALNRSPDFSDAMMLRNYFDLVTGKRPGVRKAGQRVSLAR